MEEVENMSDRPEKQHDSQRHQVLPINEVESAAYDKGFQNTQGDATGTNGKDKLSFKESTKKKIQLSFENVVIQTIPQRKKLCNKNAP
jgi:hypothetical protein